jgi:formylglycine-generating enzyme required for sulfatase activity
MRNLALWLNIVVALAVSSVAHAAEVSVKPVSFKDCTSCPEMVVVPAGTFVMGSDHVEPVAGEFRPEGPIHEVRIPKAFAVGKYEITNEEFSSFVDATGYQASEGCIKWRGEQREQEFGGTWRNPDYGRDPGPREPVVCVNWRDAKAYTTWLAKTAGKPYRLLSEAEWEYLAHGGTQTTWPWGENPDNACATANVFDDDGADRDKAFRYASWQPVKCRDGFGIVSPVGALQANSFGVHDIIGNVWEWTQDCSLRFYDPARNDGKPVEVEGECDRRAVRGGSWFSQISRNRVTFRGRDPELRASHIFGFRVAMTLP